MSSGNIVIDTPSYGLTRQWSGANRVNGESTPEHPYYLLHKKRISVPFDYYYYDGYNQLQPNGTQTWLSGYSNGCQLPGWDYAPNLQLEALNKAIENVKGSDFNAAVFMSQLPLALGQVVNTTTALLGGVQAFSRGNIPGAVRAFSRVTGNHGFQQQRTQQWLGTKLSGRYKDRYSDIAQKRMSAGDISGSWLAMQYGYLPLISDVSNLMDAIKSMTESRKLIGRGRKTFKTVVSGKDFFGLSGNTEPNRPPPVTVELRASVKLILQEELSANRMLGLIDPVGVAWELLPWSFVYDWVLPIGDYLKAMSFVTGLQGTQVLSLSRASSQKDASNFYYPFGSAYLGGSIDCTNFELTRTVTQLSPLSVPRPRQKTLSKTFSLGHLENAAALIQQALPHR